MKFINNLITTSAFLFLLITSTYAQSTETRKLSSFEGVSIGGAFTVYLQEGNSPSIKIEASSEDISKIITEVKNGTLRVKVKPGSRNVDGTLYITYSKNLSAISLSGACKVTTKSTLKGSTLALNGSGSGKYQLQLSVGELKANFSGSNQANLEGNAKRVNLNSSGSAKVYGSDLKVGDASIKLSGSGYVEMEINGDLQASISGSGKVRYKGNPTNVQMNVSGSGKVQKLD
ncbi:head GIN domain-containing protein [Rapidithrix thailandica]|uniref:Head GIN domain-containing protein n=1 Tax=Rapidithrix thailandica TaxID=413964 RepID=A0AAW9S949_9BACT